MSPKRYLFIGRSERLVIALMLSIAAVGFALYAFTTRRSERLALEQQATGDRADTLYTNKHYVGPPNHAKNRSQNKFTKKTVLDLNRVDSLTLLRVPGIGPAFAHRILELRRRLGGYYTVLQLQEVYGMDEDKYLALRGWFHINTPQRRYYLDSLKADELPEHHYLNWQQRKTINGLLHRHGQIKRWSQLMREAEVFTRDDSIRLSPYFPERPSEANSED